MECPKCSAICADDAVECPRCGVVVAKAAIRAAQAAALEPPPVPAAPVAETPDVASSGAVRVARVLLIAGLAVWTFRFARAPIGVAATDSILHLPNLVFHEAGHIILGVFGRFVGVLGGSLFQFAVPLVLGGAFLRQRDQFEAAVCAWWAGQNLLDLAPYIADARALQLVLLGGRTGAEVEGHDWEYLLGEMNLLHMDRTLGLAAHRLGLVMMAAALTWAAVSVRRGRA